MARLRGGLGAGGDQDQSQDQFSVPQIGGAMANAGPPGGDPSGNPTPVGGEGNLTRPGELHNSLGSAPTTPLRDPGKSATGGPPTSDNGEHATPGRPASPTPIVSQPPQPFTPLPSQDAGQMLATPDQGAVAPSPVFGGSSMRSPVLGGGSGGQLGGGLGVGSSGEMGAENPLSALLRQMLSQNG